MNSSMCHFTAKYATPGARRRALTALVILCLLVLHGCSENKKKNGETGNRVPKAMPVTIGFSTIKSVPVALNAVGTVEPLATVAIKSQITGILKSVHFKESDDVKKGDLLFSIDERPFTALFNQALGTLARDRAELENARKEPKR